MFMKALFHKLPFPHSQNPRHGKQDEAVSGSGIWQGTDSNTTYRSDMPTQGHRFDYLIAAVFK